MPTTDRLTPLDASFLTLETPASHMHVACVMIFDGDAPDYEHFVSLVESRLDQVPRYRQRLAEVPFNQGRPKWVDDEHFDLRYHVRATALPRPATEYELQVLAGRVFSQQLNRDKPLWEMWLVDGLEGGRFAILSKTHHALVDGIAGMDILSVLFGEPPDGSGSWQPRPAPSSLELLAEALWERATMPAEIARAVGSVVTSPLRLLGQAKDTVVGAGEMVARTLLPAPQTPFNPAHEIGTDRRFTWVRASLEDVKAIKHELGGTVNDVVLTIVSRALRRELERRGSDIEDMELRVFVPVSVRSTDERGDTGNRVSGMVVPLPVGCADAVVCLDRVRRHMDALKASGQSVGARALIDMTGLAPPTILHQAGRVAAPRQRFINLVVTNVPGPQTPLHLEDRELLDIFPMVPLGGNLALGVAILSYHGRINFGLIGDFDAMPDLDELADDFRAGLAELATAAGVQLSDPGEPGSDAGAGEGDEPSDVATHRAASLGNGAPLPEPAPVAAPEVVELPDTEPAPVPEEAKPDVPPSDPRFLTPTADGDQAGDGEAPTPLAEGHVEEEAEVVAESADTGAEDGAGAALRVEPPWEGYGKLKAADVVDRLATASDEEIAVAQLYEGMNKKRKKVLAAAERELKRRQNPATRGPARS